jgi:hypothetical protein
MHWFAKLCYKDQYVGKPLLTGLHMERTNHARNMTVHSLAKVHATDPMCLVSYQYFYTSYLLKVESNKYVKNTTPK